MKRERHTFCSARVYVNTRNHINGLKVIGLALHISKEPTSIFGIILKYSSGGETQEDAAATAAVVRKGSKKRKKPGASSKRPKRAEADADDEDVNESEDEEYRPPSSRKRARNEGTIPPPVDPLAFSSLILLRLLCWLTPPPPCLCIVVVAVLDEEDADADVARLENPLPGFIDPITLEEVEMPAISPSGHVMGYKNWSRFDCLTICWLLACLITTHTACV